MLYEVVYLKAFCHYRSDNIFDITSNVISSPISRILDKIINNKIDKIYIVVELIYYYSMI